MLGRQEHSFTLTPARAVHSSITMFKARIIATMLPLYQDAIRVFEVPDHTSVVRCDREQSVLGEPVQCSIEAKQKMRAIDTHVSAFHVHGQRVGRVGALAAVVSDDSEKRKKRKTKDKMMGDNVDHSTSFTFRYIITDPEVQFGEMNVTIDVRREQKTGASDDASVDLDLNSSTDSSSSADHNVVVLTSPRIKHDIPSETDYLTLARQCMFKYQFKQAIVHLSAQLKLRPPGTGEGDAANTDASHSEPGHNYTPAEYQDLRSNALSLRGQLLTLTGRFARARKDYKQLSVSTEGSKGQGFKAKLKLLQKADRMQSRGMLSHARGAWHEAINYLSQALEIAQESAKLHLLRADAAYKAQLYSYVRFDTAMVLKSSPQQKRAVLLISRALYYILDQVEASVSNLKLCLKFHPEDKNCQAEYAFIHRIYEVSEQRRLWQTRIVVYVRMCWVGRSIFGLSSKLQFDK